MSKIYAVAFATLFAAVSVAATTAPASAKIFGHNAGLWESSFSGGFPPIVVEEQPVYCVLPSGKLYTCSHN